MSPRSRLYSVKAIALLAILLSACFLTAPGHAQSWVEHDWDYGGSTTGNVFNELTPSSGTSNSWGWDIYDLYGDAYSWFGFGDSSIDPTHYDAGSIDMNWTKTIVMRWEDADGNLAPNPPAHQLFRVGAYAEGYAGADTDNQNWLPEDLLDDDLAAATLSADDGLEDAANTVSTYGYPDYATECLLKVSSGHHLMPKDSSSGTVTFTVSGSAKASGQHVSTGVCDWLDAGGDVYDVEAVPPPPLTLSTSIRLD